MKNNDNVSIPVATLNQLRTSAENGLNVIESLTASVPRTRSVHAALAQLHYVVAELSPRPDSSNTTVKPSKSAPRTTSKKTAHKERRTALYNLEAVDSVPRGYVDVNTLVKSQKVPKSRVYKALKSCRKVVRFGKRVHVALGEIKGKL